MKAQGILKDFTFRWNQEKICVRVGSRGGLRTAAPSLRELLHQTEGMMPVLLRPQAAYTIIDRDETNGHPVFDKAVQVALGVVTIGPALETEVERAFRDGDPLQGLVLDAFGTEAIVQTFRQVEQRIVDEALDRDLWPSKRFSPGYKGWPLEEQRFLFSRVDAAAIGVKLNDSCMMIPRKSNSFRINFYPDRTLTTRRLPL
ncbi:MAG: hypothetical protein NTU60_06975 [Candidatus Aminicenantes bacterium]|nr:hypothetical protein [Candidatus Aminicenantes bacterium]